MLALVNSNVGKIRYKRIFNTKIRCRRKPRLNWNKKAEIKFVYSSQNQSPSFATAQWEKKAHIRKIRRVKLL